MLALIGASIKMRSGDTVDVAIREQIETGLELVLGRSPVELDEAELAPMLTTIEMAFAEGSELFKNPGRTAGWKVEDRQLLQAMGRASSTAFDRIVGLAASRASLREALDGLFLDVGTGVGGIAIRAAEMCPDLDIEAIDIWEPALRLVAENVAASPHAGRIKLRNLDVAAIEAGPRYTLAWLPTMFMKRTVVHDAVARIAAASCRGAWIVASLYTKPNDPFTAVMTSLRTLRGGGEVTDPSEIKELLHSFGYVDLEVDTAPLATFVLGRLP
jgi:precorrin-6B methylase 2